MRKLLVLVLALAAVPAAPAQDFPRVTPADPPPIVRRVEALERRAEVAESRAADFEARLTALERGQPRPARAVDNYPDVLAATVARVPAAAMATYTAPPIFVSVPPTYARSSHSMAYSASSMMSAGYGMSMMSGGCAGGACGGSAGRGGLLARVLGRR